MQSPLLQSSRMIGTQNRQYERREQRNLHGTSAIRPTLQKRSILSREDCMGLVDFYAEDYSTLSIQTSQAQLPDPISTDPRLMAIKGTHTAIFKPDTLYNQIAKQGEVGRIVSILEDSKCSHDEAWRAYELLPSPGLVLLPDWSKRRLLQRLATTKQKDQVSMFRFLSVMDDMSALGVPMDKSAWSSAVAFAGHGYGRITAASVESALLKWKEMEVQNKIQSGHVTFNILFDLATKAGKFVLAEMIMKEMEARKLRLCRFARVGLIYYHGMKRDGEGVRQAYGDLVDAGEIVDTVVINCVIASLIRSGELPAAEHVFERMKQVLRTYTGRHIPNIDWREPRDLGRVLDRAAQEHRDNPQSRQKIQDQQYLAPSQQTFAIFIEHHATKTGELTRISSLVTEMQQLGIPMEGRIFVRIFKGFARHGGIRYTAWTRARLESVWDALLNALDQKLDLVTIDRWLIVWAVQAFEKCFGHEQVLIIWEELRKRFKGDFRELATVQDILREPLAKAVQHAGRI